MHAHALKILVLEYISGGGFSQQALPSSLLTEGALMLRALLDDCARLDGVSITVMLDGRCQAIVEGYGIESRTVHSAEDFFPVFQQCLEQVDVVWLVAPEFSGILQHLTALVEAKGMSLLGSNAASVAITADKWLTFKALHNAGIQTVSSALLTEQLTYQTGCWVIKARDGVGCNSIWCVEQADAYHAVVNNIERHEDFIVQPYMTGQSMSLSCLFYQGKAWCLCVNEQLLVVQDQSFLLQGCYVNRMPIQTEHQILVDKIALAVPGLQGYVGIDFISSTEAENYTVVEINPRLTSSYIGIYEALGLNVVELVLNLPQLGAKLEPLCNIQVHVSLAKG